jgi:large subunit ribosomal protein L21
MYAIVKTGGKQYRVERGQRLLIERLAVEEGANVALEPILYRSDEAVFDKDGLAGVKVTAKVLAHVRGEKLRVFKFKPKRGYKRRTGHRQDLTSIEVTEITAGKAKPAAKPARAKRAEASGEKAATGGASPAKASAASTKAGKDKVEDGS